jgi:hypothetical protein
MWERCDILSIITWKSNSYKLFYKILVVGTECTTLYRVIIMKKKIIFSVLFEQILNFRPKWGDDDGEGADEVDDGQDDGVAGPDFLGGPRGLVLRPIPVPKLWVTTVPDPTGVVRPGCCDPHVLPDGHHLYLRGTAPLVVHQRGWGVPGGGAGEAGVLDAGARGALLHKAVHRLRAAGAV